MTWNPDQYLKFSEPRLRPALDLLARIDSAAPHRVCDLGCGAGNVTGFLKRRWPNSHVTGVDDSESMLAKAKSSHPDIEWIHHGIDGWKASTPYDVVYSNAALHWLPNHGELFRTLLGLVEPGGWLAIQMPRNFLAPSHTLVTETVLAGRWKAKLEHLLAPPPVAEPRFYLELLSPLVAKVDIWETEYLQVLEGSDPVKEWVKGTWLKQFLDALTPDEAPLFEAEYASRVSKAYPPLSDGSTPFPFRRLFIVAQMNP